MTQFSVTTAGLMKAFEAYNQATAKDNYATGVKPFDFFIHPVLKNMAGNTWQLSSNENEDEEEPKPVTLVAPYSQNPWDVTRTRFINLYDPSRACRVVMETSPGVVDLSRVDWDVGKTPTFVVRSLADMLLSYLRKPESGMVDRHGNFSSGRTTGPLYHATTEIGEIKYIGKETNLLDMVANGIVAPGNETLAFYTPDEWENEILPRLENIPVWKIVRETGIDAGNLSLYLSRKRRPEEDTLNAIKKALPRLDEYDEWNEIILPWMRKLPASIISRLTGISKRHINRLKSGKEQPSPKTVEKFCRALGLATTAAPAPTAAGLQVGASARAPAAETGNVTENP